MANGLSVTGSTFGVNWGWCDPEFPQNRADSKFLAVFFLFFSPKGRRTGAHAVRESNGFRHSTAVPLSDTKNLHV